MNAYSVGYVRAWYGPQTQSPQVSAALVSLRQEGDSESSWPTLGRHADNEKPSAPLNWSYKLKATRLGHARWSAADGSR